MEGNLNVEDFSSWWEDSTVGDTAVFDSVYDYIDPNLLNDWAYTPDTYFTLEDDLPSVADLSYGAISAGQYGSSDDDLPSQNGWLADSYDTSTGTFKAYEYTDRLKSDFAAFENLSTLSGSKDWENTKLELNTILGSGALDNVGVIQNADKTLSFVEMNAAGGNDPPTEGGYRTITKDSNPDLWGTIKSAFGTLNTFAGTPLGKLAVGAGIGAVSLGISKAVTGDVAKVKVPPPAAQPAAFQAGTSALTTALEGTTPGGTTTGKEDLASAYRSGLAGQKSLAELLNTQAGEQLKATTAEAPLASAIRLGALGDIPTLTKPTKSLADTLSVGDLETTRAKELLTDPAAKLSDATLDTINTKLTSLLTDPATTLDDPTLRVINDELTAALNDPANPIDDPILTGLNKEITNVLTGQYSNADLENRIKRSREAFEAKMYAQLGPGWELSTPGIQAKETQDLLEISTREKDKKDTLASYLPQSTARGQFAITNPQTAQQNKVATLLPQSTSRGQFAVTNPQGVTQNTLATLLPQATTREQFSITNPQQVRQNQQALILPQQKSTAELAENAQQTRLGNATTLAALGTTPTTSLTQGLGAITPPETLLGLPSASAATAQQTAANNAAAAANTAATNAADQSLAKSIGDIGGVLAGGITGKKYSLAGAPGGIA